MNRILYFKGTRDNIKHDKVTNVHILDGITTQKTNRYS